MAWWEKLNAALFPYIGPPPLGPYDEPEQPPSSSKACPMCGNLMADHVMDRAPGRPTYMSCPTGDPR